MCIFLALSSSFFLAWDGFVTGRLLFMYICKDVLCEHGIQCNIMLVRGCMGPIVEKHVSAFILSSKKHVTHGKIIKLKKCLRKCFCDSFGMSACMHVCMHACLCTSVVCMCVVYVCACVCVYVTCNHSYKI